MVRGKSGDWGRSGIGDAGGELPAGGCPRSGDADADDMLKRVLWMVERKEYAPRTRVQYGSCEDIDGCTVKERIARIKMFVVLWSAKKVPSKLRVGQVSLTNNPDDVPSFPGRTL